MRILLVFWILGMVMWLVFLILMNRADILTLQTQTITLDWREAAKLTKDCHSALI